MRRSHSCIVADRILAVIAARRAVEAPQQGREGVAE